MNLTPDHLRQIFSLSPYPQNRPWELRWAAVGLIFRPKGQDFELLFIERAQHPEDPWSGHMAFPGGKQDPGETLLQTAHREVQEEVGLNLNENTDLLGYHPPLQTYKFGRPQNFSLIPVGFLLKADQQLILDPNEVAATFWLSMSWLLDENNHQNFSYKHDQGEVQMPSIPLSNNKIWGLTYKVLAELSLRTSSIKF